MTSNTRQIERVRRPMLVLTFHGVGPITREISEREREFWLEYEEFVRVLDFVMGIPNVELTFDDGNASDVQIALPELNRRNLRATFFICSGRINRAKYLTSEEIQQLHSQSMTIGSHGVRHVAWLGLGLCDLAKELVESRRVLEDICHARVEKVSCPYGDYGRQALQLIRASGYRYVYTSDGGWTSSIVPVLPRNTLRRGMAIYQVNQLVSQGSRFWKAILRAAKITIKAVR